MTRLLRIWIARRRLEKLVAKQRAKVADYPKHRAAGKLGWQRRRMA